MAAMTKNRNFFKWPKLLNFKPESAVEIGSVVSEEKIFFKFHPPFFLICIIGQNRQKFKVHKKFRNKKKSSLLKLQSQSQPNFAEMILGWSSSKFVSGISEHRPRWPPQPNLV
jgi:hypothetical protein